VWHISETKSVLHLCVLCNDISTAIASNNAMLCKLNITLNQKKIKEFSIYTVNHKKCAIMFSTITPAFLAQSL